jgi:lysophospholipase L1-like esterase
MKIPVFLLWLGLASSAFAQANTGVWPMPDRLPGAPGGDNTAAFPTPKFDWVERVKKTNARAHENPGEIELVFDGDSITDFFWPSDRGKEIWNARYAKYHAFNFAISGDRTEHLLWRLESGQIDGIHPKLVVLLIGTNNLDRNTNEEIVAGIKAIVEAYRKHSPDAVILLQAIFPRGEKASDPNRARIKEINRAISQFGDGQHVVFIDFGDKFLSPDGSLSPEIMPDFLHPSKKGYEIWADAIQPTIDKYLAH